MNQNEDLINALASCLEALERKELGRGECLELHPQHKDELSLLLEKFEVVRSFPLETARSAFRKAGHQALLSAIKNRQPATLSGRLRSGMRQLAIQRPRKFSPVQIIAAASLALFSVTGGVAYASDGAAPGDMLYGLDRAIERVRLQMAADVEDTIALRLAFAEERLKEVEDRIAADDMDDAQVALGYYDAEIDALAELVLAPDSLDGSEMTGLVDAALVKHNEVLLSVLEKVPEGAQEAIQNAIEKQDKVRGYLKDKDKPEKPDKPGKPDKPEKTGKPEDPGSQIPDGTP